MKTLRSKFLIYILIPVVVIVSALTVLSYLTARGLLIDQMKKSGRNFLRASAEDISSRVVQIQSIIQLMAITENIEEKTDSERHRLFVELKGLLGGAVTSVFMGFPDGKFIRAKTDPLPQDYDPRTRPWYRGAMHLSPGVVGGITKPYFDASTQRPTLTLYHKVLNDNQGIVGVLGVDVDVALASQNLTRNMSVPFGGHLFLVSSDATVLIHPDHEMVGSDINANGEELDQQLSGDVKNNRIQFRQYLGKRQNAAWYMGFHRVKATGICFVLSAPAKTVLKPLRHLTYQMAGLATFLISGLLVLFIVMTQRISRPIIDLKDSAMSVTENGSYQDALDVKSRDEVGQLTMAFNEMMEGLRQRDFIRDTFGRYVTKEVVEELIGTPNGLELGGETREITIMFSDLRGFTPLCEQLRPDQVIEILNRYLGKMTPVIGQYNGTINEFIGDAILTIFGAPIRRDDSSTRAVACAVALQLAMEDLNHENRDRGLPPLFMGIGIHTGDVIVGNIGSKERAKYGVVGHNINLASRVEGATVGGQILITQSTYAQVKHLVIVRDVRSMEFKGVEDEINIYDVTGIKEPYNLYLPELTTDTKPLKKPISVFIRKTPDKKTESSVLNGQLTHFSGHWAKVRVAEKITPPLQIRIDLTETEKSNAPHIYAKVFQITEQDESFLHLVRISHLSPTAEKYINASF
jgi:class 3 adenylate cyclase